MVNKQSVTQRYRCEGQPTQLSVALLPAARVMELQQERLQLPAACAPLQPATDDQLLPMAGKDTRNRTLPAADRDYFSSSGIIRSAPQKACSCFIPQAH